MNDENGFFALLRAFLVRALFTVGLCTTAYWSVAKIHQEMNPSQSSSAKREDGQTLRDKVDSLNQDQALGAIPSADFQKPALSAVGQAPAASVAVAEVSPSPPAIGDSVVANDRGFESPSPSPVDAQAQAQEGNNGEMPVAEPFYPSPYAYHQAMVETVREEIARENAAKTSGTSTSATGANTDSTIGQPMIGMFNPNKPKSSSGGVGSGATSNNASASVNSNLTSQDTQWLLSTNLRANIPALKIDNLAAHKIDGSSVTNVSVWSSRWALDKGLRSEATFAIRSSSAPYPVQFEITFNLEDHNRTALPVQMTLKPSDSNARNDVLNGRAVRVYTFSTADLSLLEGTSNSETAKSLSVRLVYDISGGSPVFVDGSFAFQRASVRTDSTPWEAGRTIASNDQNLVIVDQFPFSMKLEKSQ